MHDTAKRQADARNTSAAHVEAHRALEAAEPDTYRALMGAVITATAGMDDDDAASAACLAVASLYRGNIGATVASAIRQGRAVAAAVAAAAEPVDTTDAVTMGRLPVTMPAADARYRLTPRDLAGAVLRCMDDTAHRDVWRASVGAWLAHRPGSCDACTGGRMPTVATILAHRAGIARGTAEHKRLTRAVRAAIGEALPRVAEVLRAYSDARPRPAWDDTTREASARMRAVAEYRLALLLADARAAWDGAPEPDTSLIAHTREGRTVMRALDAWERETIAGAGARVEYARHAGEQYGADTSRAGSMPDAWTGTVRSHKRPVSPRKRAAGTTGPTVPAWRAH